MTLKAPVTVNEAVINREFALSEVRSMLASAIDELKAFPALSEISSKQLKDFWHKDYPPAPFEEVLTLKQMTTINIDTFFKKRSVVPAKILGIVAAINNAVAYKSTAKHAEAKSSPATPVDPILNKRAKFYELEYNSLMNKCQMMIELLRLAQDASEFSAKSSKTLTSITSDIKKIDKLLASSQEKLSKLI